MSTAAGALTVALTEVWGTLRRYHPDLPPAQITLSPTATSPSHGPERWSLDGHGALIGLTVGGSVLAAGAKDVLTYVLHEAAHVLNWRRGISDVSARGVYHNGQFLTAAQEVGLTWPDEMEKPPGRGFSTPVLSPAAMEQWAAAVASLQPLTRQMHPFVVSGMSTARTRPDRLTLTCGCNPVRRIRAAKSSVDPGPIVCGVCGQEFTGQG